MDALYASHLDKGKIKTTYFQPGEVAVLVSHRQDTLDKKNYVRLSDWMTSIAQKAGLSLTLLQESSFSFPAVQGEMADRPATQHSKWSEYLSPQFEKLQPFTLLLANVSKPRGKPENMPRSLLANFANFLDASRDELSLSEGVTLQVISPNWLASPTPSGWGGTGGPGGRPSPFRGNLPPAYKMKILGIERLVDKNEEKRGEGVVVAILDTAPTDDDLDFAANYWSGTRSHGLAETLLGANGRLTVHHASSAERQRMSHVRLQDHHYLMRDHGLFVAGIIHSLAPAAEIHLFEVLNEYGVGDIMTITEGLKNALASRSGQYLVVNCSLVLSLTPVDSRNPRLLGKRLRDFKPIVHMHGEELETWVERHVLPLRWACQNIYQAGSRVVAAAGNDKKGKIRPQADYPAAFESVVGVGALQKGRLEPASYSNFSDRPETTGIITLGGEQGEEQGVLGIYLGNFPAEAVGVQAPENESGWAWWAGTSFATPIMTGLVAALLGTGKYPTTEAAIRALYAANVFQTTSSNEDALVVEQG